MWRFLLGIWSGGFTLRLSLTLLSCLQWKENVLLSLTGNKVPDSSRRVDEKVSSSQWPWHIFCFVFCLFSRKVLFFWQDHDTFSQQTRKLMVSIYPSQHEPLIVVLSKYLDSLHVSTEAEPSHLAEHTHQRLITQFSCHHFTLVPPPCMVRKINKDIVAMPNSICVWPC